MIILYFILLIMASCIVTLATIALVAFLCITIWPFIKPFIQPIVDKYVEWWNRRTM